MGSKPSYRRIHRTFFSLIDQTYYFPQAGFQVDGNAMRFHHIPLMDLVARHGTPLKLTYLPDITAKIAAAQDWFAKSIEEYGYGGKYYYSYCTKSNHFSYVLREAFKTPIHLEMSSAFDVDLAFKLFEEGLIDHKTYILANGFKTPNYLEGILRLHQAGFENVIPILDNMNELDAYEEMDFPFFKIGMRVATEEQPGFDLYTSRFGIRHSEMLKFYRERIHDNPRVSLAMLHFFVYTGIRDTTYYWNEFDRCIKLYCDLCQLCPYLTKLNIGGGFPIRQSLGDEYDGLLCRGVAAGAAVHGVDVDDAAARSAAAGPLDAGGVPDLRPRGTADLRRACRGGPGQRLPNAAPQPADHVCRQPAGVAILRGGA